MGRIKENLIDNKSISNNAEEFSQQKSEKKQRIWYEKKIERENATKKLQKKYAL